MATLDDLHRTEGQAELIGGRIVRYKPAGFLPNRIVGNIYMSLRVYKQERRSGWAFTSTLAYAIPALPSGRESFSPDASYYIGPLPRNEMQFIEGPPTFAVEVRSESDYTASAEVDMAAKRVDYFLAGTLVVWDVDPLAETVRLFRGDASTEAVVFHRGEIAEAEPAVPGWRMPVDDVFAL